MQVESQRLTNLVNDLMDLSRLQGVDPLHRREPVDVDAVVAEALDDDAAARPGTRDRVRRRRPSPAVSCRATSRQLVMALRNLLTNAVTYSPPRTKVAVDHAALRRRAGDDRGHRPGDRHPRAPSSRASSSASTASTRHGRAITGGTGLGLAIVKHVCANHGGECDVWSRARARARRSPCGCRLPRQPGLRRTRGARRQGGRQ